MMRVADIHRAWRMLPEGELDDVIGDGTCLILAPHPDDESLGCGGLIAACVSAGRPPLVAVMTDGAASHNSPTYPPAKLGKLRAQEVTAAVEALGLPPDRLWLGGLPDAAAPLDGPRFKQSVKQLLSLMKQAPSCGTVIGPWKHDPHCDHEAVARMAEAVADRAACQLLSYPVWGWMLPDDDRLPVPHVAGWRLGTARFAERKRQAIEAHRSQHAGLITDDPDGFALPAKLLSQCTQPFEVFLHR